jgi:hypothetical protein
LTESLDEKISRLRKEFEKLLHSDGSALSCAAASPEQLGLSEVELKRLMANEPDFTKRVVQPLDGKRPPDKLPVYRGGSPHCSGLGLAIQLTLPGSLLPCEVQVGGLSSF